MNQQQLAVGWVFVVAFGASAALFFVTGLGPILSLATMVITALLFGNWYRTSKPMGLDSEPSLADSETFDGFTVYWTTESAEHAAL